jgi:hypothetical protein
MPGEGGVIEIGVWGQCEEWEAARGFSDQGRLYCGQTYRTEKCTSRNVGPDEVCIAA